MLRFNVIVALIALLSASEFAVGSEELAITIDATKQTMRPPRGRGPFPGSPTPGHSDGFPIGLEIEFPTVKVASQGSVLVDFVLRNVGTQPIKLPCSAALIPNPNVEGISILILWITSDAIIDQYATDVRTGRPFKISGVGISAELDGDASDPMTFCILEPSQFLKVHAETGVALKMGTHSFTAHAELVSYSTGIRRPETADSKPIRKTLSIARPGSR